MSARMRRQPVAITPFWLRMPRFFLYPLTPPGLYVLLALAFLNGFLLDLVQGGMGARLLALVLLLVAYLFAIKYGFDILEKTAHGESLPPRLNRETLIEGYELPFKQIGVFLVLGFVGWALFLVQPLLVLVFFAAVALLLPAIIATLALERSVAAALNPRTLFGVAWRIGWPYLVVLALLLLLNGGAGTVMQLFGQHLPTAGRAFVGAFAQNFFAFTMMNLLGYLIYQYHDRVGFEPATLAAADDGWGELLAPVDEAIDAGDHREATHQLRRLIQDHPAHAIDLRYRRHQVLRLTDDEHELIDNAALLLAELIDANRMREATEIYIDITDIDPALRPAREGDYDPLLNMLVQRGEYRRAVRMVNGFHKDFPDSAMVAPLYLEIARLFLDPLGQPAKARQIADFVIRHFPDHPAAQRARALRASVTD